MLTDGIESYCSLSCERGSIPYLEVVRHRAQVAEAASGSTEQVFWENNWLRRNSLSYRKKTNKKTKSTEERLPKIKRWHARLRLRLQTPQEGETVDPVWGVWLPNDRYNVDQIVPTEHVNHAKEHQVVAAGGLFMPKTLTSVALVTDEEATAVAMAVAEDAAIAEVENEDAEREEESLEEEDEEVFIVEKLGAIKWINV
ncbi:hypothetical protein CYMTET_4270 [Cymbomonas tetramitiformis]|uniref:Uncharacterized protein n=1 Tax=Cymbomonas tetramitiformis TaxID=36881 RepID=A0AAE0LK10_9CHLO|nr:hypothetical protein CYMTET_4270 [Cymbomonas tetramitiformis]